MEHFDTLHLLIAYGGLLVYYLILIGQNPCTFKDCFTKREILTLIASVIAIPIILIICSDTSMKDILPINHVTAFLAGYQTQDTLAKIGYFGNKFNKNKVTE